MSSTATTCAIVQSDRAFVGPRAGFGEDRFQPGGPRLGRQHARRELRPDPPLPLFALWGTLARSMSDTGVGADSKSVCRMYGSVVVLEYEVIRRARRPVKRVRVHSRVEDDRGCGEHAEGPPLADLLADDHRVEDLAALAQPDRVALPYGVACGERVHADGDVPTAEERVPSADIRIIGVEPEELGHESWLEDR
jgi:hypothetical protein